MTYRPKLRSAICESWQEVFKKYFCQGRINSERSLQAALWSRLSKKLNPKTRQIFIEPGIRIKGEEADGTPYKEARLPDFVICDSKQIVCVMEIKYLPRAQASMEKDFLKFDWLIQKKTAIKFLHFRHALPDESKEYKLADHVLFVWAGIHREGEHRTHDFNYAPGQEYLELHIDTSKSEKSNCRKPVHNCF